MNKWTRIPADIPSESDRRQLMAILADRGLEVRMKKDKPKNLTLRFVEFREFTEDGAG